jgi:hypothetical protein
VGIKKENDRKYFLPVIVCIRKVKCITESTVSLATDIFVERLCFVNRLLPRRIPIAVTVLIPGLLRTGNKKRKQENP